MVIDGVQNQLANQIQMINLKGLAGELGVDLPFSMPAV